MSGINFEKRGLTLTRVGTVLVQDNPRKRHWNHVYTVEGVADEGLIGANGQDLKPYILSLLGAEDHTQEEYGQRGVFRYRVHDPNTSILVEEVVFGDPGLYRNLAGDWIYPRGDKLGYDMLIRYVAMAFIAIDDLDTAEVEQNILEFVCDTWEELATCPKKAQEIVEKVKEEIKSTRFALFTKEQK